MITASQVHWIAGLLEGEGTFCYTTFQGKSNSIRIGLSMTDKDIILRIANLLGFGSIHKIGQDSNHLSKQPQYRWETSGIRAAGLMMTIYTLMGERRQAKIRELLAHYRSTKVTRKSRAQANRQFVFG